MKPWVADSGPLLFLAKIDRLALLRTGRDILVPQAVVREVGAHPDEAAGILQDAFGDWIRVETVSDSEILRLLRHSLGTGEAEVLALAATSRAERVIFDDQDARRFAQRLEIPTIGTLGLLLAARQQGVIPSLGSEIRRLEQAGFYASRSLVQAALREVGEER